MLEEPAAAAGTEVASAEFLVQFLVTMNDAAAALHLGLRRITTAAFTQFFEMRRIEKRIDRERRRFGNLAVAWDTVPLWIEESYIFREI